MTQLDKLKERLNKQIIAIDKAYNEATKTQVRRYLFNDKLIYKWVLQQIKELESENNR